MDYIFTSTKTLVVEVQLDFEEITDLFFQWMCELPGGKLEACSIHSNVRAFLEDSGLNLESVAGKEGVKERDLILGNNLESLTFRLTVVKWAYIKLLEQQDEK